ncbi:MAG: A/G-specific adenine glycosylase [Pirellulaceae bacterium]|nr:MAG: A/G-specific adenine glycosylase [Pirellulaceae bacterium]
MRQELADWTAQNKAAFRRRLLGWYSRHRRDLPWRKTRDPYAIWVSEVMLQQTQVATAVAYFQRFLQRFPDPTALAAAPLEEVLRYWEGLGYYRRAAQLWEASRKIVGQHGGRIPDRFEELIVLPGVGRYTAGAILSLAFDKPAPILEANTERLYLRLLGWQVPAGTVKQHLWEFAESLLPRRNIGQFHQAVMELGSLVCRKKPECSLCPVRTMCRAFALGLTNSIPRRTNPPQYVAITDVAVALLPPEDERLLLGRYAGGERWAGLWDFPRLAWCQEHQQPAPSAEQVCQRLSQRIGLRIVNGVHVTSVRHSVTRYRILLHFYVARTATAPRSLAPWQGTDQVRWVEQTEWERLPMPAWSRRLCRALERHRAG